MKKSQIFITKLLYFDHDKFKSHVRKRKKYNGIGTSKEYQEIIKDIVLNFKKAYEIKKENDRDQLTLVRKDDWLLIFSKTNFRIYTCMKLDDRYDHIEEFLQDMKKIKKDIIDFKEVDYENSKFKRIIKEIQK